MVDVCTRTKYEYSLVIIIIIIIIVPTINMDGSRKTPSQITMKFRVYIDNYNSDVCSKQNLTLTYNLDLYGFKVTICILIDISFIW